jgi:hypothetical protein
LGLLPVLGFEEGQRLLVVVLQLLLRELQLLADFGCSD